MRKTILRVISLSILVVLLPIYHASAEMKLTKPAETITISGLGDLVEPKVLKITKSSDEIYYHIDFMYDGYLFEGEIPVVISFNTIVTTDSQERVYDIILEEKLIKLPDGKITSARLRLSNGYAKTRDDLKKFFNRQIVKGVLEVRNGLITNSNSGTIDFLILPDYNTQYPLKNFSQ